jgi:hypothetical protein
MRLCQQAIPDESRVTLCLVQNKRQLSPACAIVFNRPRAASAARERPVTVQKTSDFRLLMQNHVQQGLVDFNMAVVINQA